MTGQKAKPRLFGYEWSFTCACGQTVGLSGLMDHPTPDEYDEEFYESEAVSERIRDIEGKRRVECPGEDCNRILEIGIEVVEDNE